MTKEALRKIYLHKRLALSEVEYIQLSQQLCDLFFASIDLSFIRVLHIFLPIEKKKEPNTWLIIDRIRREFPHIRLSISRVHNQTGILENFYFEGLHQLQKSKWDIWEPKQGIPTESEKIDMVLVPLLIFDKQGHRVGYGKGFYDAFLKTCRKDCRKIGLSFFEPVDRIDDLNQYDTPLNFCINTKGKHQF
ncbi:MAG: 5-formyltetrahydrofolate cyclo-ligase [Cyclobacteriaceae bacterium]|nr:5-formyltetrahydrofolate cyclo-ligase [Cyclobacteriaceae bacterium]